ncbi:hypothetical protein ACB092_07G157100 [Castanea dentata]
MEESFGFGGGGGFGFNLTFTFGHCHFLQSFGFSSELRKKTKPMLGGFLVSLVVLGILFALHPHHEVIQKSS